MPSTKKKKPSFISLFGLSAVLFFISDVRNGVNPFLSLYLQSDLKWDAGSIGIALASMDIADALSQIPSGLIIDATKWKRLLVVLACGAVSLGCIITLTFPNLYAIVIAQSFVGIGSAIIPAALAAITLGLVGRKVFPKRTSINETWNHAGNVATAITAGVLGSLLGHRWILYVVIIYALISIVFLLLIRPDEIDHDVARELHDDGNGDSSKPMPILKYLRETPILVFCFSVALFHLSNAAQLPLVGEMLARDNPKFDAMFMAACIILGQAVMIGIAYSTGFIMPYVGRKPIFLVGFAALPVRAMLYTFTNDPTLLLAIQLLDGVGAGIFSVLAVVTISDIAKGSGRFNMSVGLMAVSLGIGASTSNVMAGFIVKSFGYNAGFITLALVAIIGLAFYGLVMPETKEQEAISQ
jgi:MFS family permease